MEKYSMRIFIYLSPIMELHGGFTYKVPLRMMIMASDNQKTYYCIHCHRPFKNWYALVSHLKGCKERKLKRVFYCSDFKFTILLNPHHRVVNALNKLQYDYPSQPKVFLGAMLFLQNASFIESFEITPMQEGLDASELYR